MPRANDLDVQCAASVMCHSGCARRPSFYMKRRRESASCAPFFHDSYESCFVRRAGSMNSSPDFAGRFVDRLTYLGGELDHRR